ncbi:hypothetical protein F2Q70_00032830 [Brassica cretica]|nr:hypothetical protein F2Q70_00032830 [Brassica cretica]KAF3597287.1 hypothetical protein DY000_02026955 [Brassica cretica]
MSMEKMPARGYVPNAASCYMKQYGVPKMKLLGSLIKCLVTSSGQPLDPPEPPETQDPRHSIKPLPYSCGGSLHQQFHLNRLSKDLFQTSSFLQGSEHTEPAIPTDVVSPRFHPSTLSPPPQQINHSKIISATHGPPEFFPLTLSLIQLDEMRSCLVFVTLATRYHVGR